jgi:ABC-2 type transport system permease protein
VSAAGLALRQLRYENLAFWRNPPQAFFTFVFPLMFLVIFNLAFGDQRVDVGTQRTPFRTFLIPAIIAFSQISACYTNVAMSAVAARDGGLLKRVRGTPLPASAFMAGKVLHSTLIAVLLVGIVVAAGAFLYGVDLPTTTLPAFLVTILVGFASFSALGLATTTVIPNEDAAPAIINAVILPLLFISDIFIRFEDPPVWLDAVRNVFPVIHLYRALETAFLPFTQGAGFEWGHLALVALWGLAGGVVAARFFSWEPRR